MAIKQLHICATEVRSVKINKQLTLAESYLEKNISSGLSIKIPSLNISISMKPSIEADKSITKKCS